MSVPERNRFKTSIASPADVAACLGLRLQAQDEYDPLGNIVRYEASYRPPDKSIAAGSKLLDKVLKTTTGDAWYPGEDIIADESHYPFPVRAIDVFDLIVLLEREKVASEVARWVVFNAIVSKKLLALRQSQSVPAYTPSTQRTKRRLILPRSQAQSLPSVRDAMPPFGLRQPYSRLVVWSKNQRLKGKAGRPPKDAMEEADKDRIRQAYEAGSKPSEIVRNMGFKSDEVRRVLDQRRKKEKRNSDADN